MEQIARTPKQIGDAIRRRRRKLGLNQAKLAASNDIDRRSR
jgi:HTH-type transcriptional regulator/antitoxin HipB